MAVLYDANRGNQQRSGSEKLPDGSEQKGQPTSFQTLLELRNQKLIAKGLSGDEKEDKGEGLAATIVKAALDTNTKATEQYQKLAERNDAATIKAREEADAAKREVNTIVAQQITGALESLVKMRDEIKHSAEQKPPPQRSLLEQLDEAKKIGAILNPQPAAPAAPVPVPDMSTTIALRQMEMAHEKAMKQLDIQLKQMEQDLAIRLAEFTDKKMERKEQFEAGNKFRNDALATVGDLAAAAAAGLQGKMGGVTSQVGGQAPAADTGEIQAYVRSFPCQGCGDRVAVPTEGNKATCPSCKIEYDLDRTPAPGQPPAPPAAPPIHEEEL